MTHQILTVDADDDGQRLDRWLKKKRPDLPHTLVQKLLRKGQVRVDGKRAAPDKRLEAGQAVRMPLGSAEEGKKKKAVQTQTRLKDMILFEDRDILVLNKPSGLAVQGGSGLAHHLEDLLAGYGDGRVPPRLVHRLDRETSGVLVVALSAGAARNLGAQFAGRDTEKTYWALCSPPPAQKKGRIDQPLRKKMSGHDIEKVAVDPRGQPSQTMYRVIATNKENNMALVEFIPFTGRTHQIRVHAAHEGFPLLGDTKYGGDTDILKKRKLKPRVHLHAQSLSFRHPRTNDPVTFTAPLPPDLQASFGAFGFAVS